MNLKSSILFASRLIKPRYATSSNARKSMKGALLCVALSLIPLVIVLVVTNGMIDGMTERIIGLSSYHAQIIDLRYKTRTLEDILTIAERVDSVDGVVSTTVEKQGIALAAGKTSRTGATVRAIDKDVFTENKAFSKYFNLVDGSLSFPTDKSAVIGEKLAKTLGLSIGDTIRIISAKSSSDSKIIPKYTAFTVSGILSCGYQELDALWVFVPIETGFSLFSGSSSQLLIGIETENPFDSSLYSICQEINTVLPPSLMVYEWSELNSQEYESFSSTKMLLLFIMFLIVLVASVNISSALVMLVMERRKEIAILKSLGSDSVGITFSFLITGVCIGIGGILIGIPIGLLCAVNINKIILVLEKMVNIIAQFVYTIINNDGYKVIHLLDPEFYLQTIPVVIPFWELFGIAVLTLALSLVVSIVPSVRAGKEKPLAILRKV